ncbi:MAG: dihydrodipicolinate synthase family protein [Acidisphaera sp.]|nr:dihydrodipicolinate synthase family protein [Acidisphaera sp.]
MQTDSISGFWVASATPIDADGGVDNALLADHAQWLFEQGCGGLVLFGTSGEGTSFTARERLATVSDLMARGIPAARLSVGAGFPATGDSVAMTQDALAMGLRHVLLLPPYFYRDAAGIEDAFAAILDAVADDRLRAMLYHIPQVSGVPVLPGTVAALRRRYGAVIAGVKDSSGVFADFEAFRRDAPEVPVLIGNEADIGRAAELGGAGTICGLGNVVPGMVRAMFSDPAAADAMRQACALFRGPFVPTLKSTLAAMTGNTAWARTRAPLRPADAALGQRVGEALRSLQNGLA